MEDSAPLSHAENWLRNTFTLSLVVVFLNFPFSLVSRNIFVTFENLFLNFLTIFRQNLIFYCSKFSILDTLFATILHSKH